MKTEEKRDSDFVTLDTDTHPRTCKSADGSTTLHRFEVRGIVYATDREDAESRISRWNLGIYLDAAIIAQKER